MWQKTLFCNVCSGGSCEDYWGSEYQGEILLDFGENCLKRWLRPGAVVSRQ